MAHFESFNNYPLRKRLKMDSYCGFVEPVCSTLLGEEETGFMRLFETMAWTDWVTFFTENNTVTPFALIATRSALEDPNSSRVIDALDGFGYPWMEFTKMGGLFSGISKVLPGVIALVASAEDVPPRDEISHGKWVTIAGDALRNENPNFENHPLGRLAIVIFGNHVWSLGDNYSGKDGKERVHLTLSHELAHVFTVLMTEELNKESASQLLGSSLWEALAEMMAPTVKDCFILWKINQEHSLVDARSSTRNRILGGASPLVNAILWGTTLQIGYWANRLRENPEHLLESWISGTSDIPLNASYGEFLHILPEHLKAVMQQHKDDEELTPDDLKKIIQAINHLNAPYHIYGRFGGTYGAPIAAANFLWDLRQAGKESMQEQGYDGNLDVRFVRDFLAALHYPDPKRVAEIMAREGIPEGYFSPLQRLEGGDEVLKTIKNAVQQQAPRWNPWGDDSLSK